ncbi:MAG: anthrone oxygenase family protein [Microterricola sp.]
MTLPDALITPLTIAAVLGGGIVAGVLLGFSSFIIRTLRELTADNGIRFMQSINRTIVRSPFILAFIGTSLLSGTLIIFGVVLATRGAEQAAAAPWLIAGGAVYLLGVFLVTALFNVPRNSALDGVDPASATGHAVWREYLTTWVGWNHVRTVAACASVVLFSIAIALL